MSAWECRDCTAAYAPGAPACPQCGTNDPIKEDEQLRKERDQMAKITRAGGPSNVDAEPGQPGYVEPEDTDTDENGHGDDPSTAGTEEADETDPAAEARALYEALTVEDLKADLKERKLSTTGLKPELVDRLVEDDARQAAEQHDGGGVS